jgi:genome maintenance exonuclease 1
MKTFQYQIPSLIQHNTKNGRFYETPDGKFYPSVTTILGTIPNPHLQKWLDEVGPEKAKEISEAAASRGTLIHSWCEAHLKGEDYTIPSYRQSERSMFMSMVPHFNFEELHANELRMWSDRLRVAGTVDCIARIGGKLKIVDFKTSRLFKRSEDIDSYWMQCAAYAVSFHERTGLLCPELRVMIATEDDGCLVYDQPTLPWVKRFIEVRDKAGEFTFIPD